MIAGNSNAPFKSSEPRAAKGTQFSPPCAPAPVGWLRNQGSARSPLTQVRAHGWSAHPGEHTHSSRLFTPPPAPRDVAWAALSLARRHTLTHACHSRQGEMAAVHLAVPPFFPRAPFAPGEIVLNEASALVGETKNLPHDFSQ